MTVENATIQTTETNLSLTKISCFFLRKLEYSPLAIYFSFRLDSISGLQIEWKTK